MNVLMRGPPHVVESKEQFGMEGDDVRVECVVEGVPRPKQVEWARGHRRVDTSESGVGAWSGRTRVELEWWLDTGGRGITLHTNVRDVVEWMKANGGMQSGIAEGG